MNGYVQLCLQPVYRRAVDGPDWVTRLLFAALVLLTPLLAALGLPWRTAWLIGIVIPSGLLGMLWWANLMNSVLQQLTPLIVLTTPLLQRRLRRVTMIAWAALVLGFAAVLTPVYGHFLSNLVWTGLVLLVWNLLTLRTSLAAISLFLWMASAYLPHQWTFTPEHLSSTGQLLASSVSVLLLGTYQLLYLFPSDARRVRRPLRLLPSKHAQTASASPRFRRYRTPTLFNWALRRDCGQRHTGRLMLHAIGRQFHWAYGLWPALAVTLIMLSLSFIFPKQLSWVLLYVLAAMVGPHAIRDAIEKTRWEQALVWLTPLMPRQPAFNRLLGRQLLKWFIVRWLIACGAILLVLACRGAGLTELLNGVFCFSIFLLPAGSVLADFSRDGHSQHSPVTIVAQIAMVVAISAYDASGLPWCWFGASCVAAASLHVLVRWRLMAATPAFLARR